jgi:putative ABC transport system permease protein
VFRHYVAPDHFKTLGVPLVRGRTFTTADATGSLRVAIMSVSAARHFWPKEDPIGQRVWFGGGSNFDRPDSSAAIVEIVGDVMVEPLDRHPSQFDFYTPYTQFTHATRMEMVRTEGDPMASVSAIRRAVSAVDPDLPLFDVQPLAARIGSSWSGHRFDAVLFGTFGAIALLLATSGIFVVVANAVAERTREIGIRLALGAQRGAMLRLVVRDGMAFPLVGAVAGIAGALALTRVLGSSLYEVAATDPRLFVATVTLLLAASVLACLVPARPLRVCRARSQARAANSGA